MVTPPAHMELKVVETDPGLRGDTATGGSKPAKLETGATVRVPLFINEGETHPHRYAHRRVPVARQGLSRQLGFAPAAELCRRQELPRRSMFTRCRSGTPWPRDRRLAPSAMRDQPIEARARRPAQSGIPASSAASSLLVHRRLELAARAPRREIPQEPPALFARIGQLVKAVGELDAVEIELEARRHPRQSRLQARERGLRGGIVADEAGPLAPELRADGESHQQIELGVAVEIVPRRRCPRRCGCAVELAIVRGVRIDAGVPPHRFGVGEPLAPGKRALGGEQLADEELDLAHQRGIVEAHADTTRGE